MTYNTIFTICNKRRNCLIQRGDASPFSNSIFITINLRFVFDNTTIYFINCFALAEYVCSWFQQIIYITNSYFVLNPININTIFIPKLNIEFQYANGFYLVDNLIVLVL